MGTRTRSYLHESVTRNSCCRCLKAINRGLVLGCVRCLSVLPGLNAYKNHGLNACMTAPRGKVEDPDITVGKSPGSLEMQAEHAYRTRSVFYVPALPHAC